MKPGTEPPARTARLRLERTLPLYVALLALGTASPFHPSPVLLPWSWQPEPLDALLNVLVFLPFGMALGSRSVVQALFLGLATSLTIEAGQMVFARTPSPFDVILNGLGAALGRAWLTRLALPITLARLLACSLVVISGVTTWMMIEASRERRPIDFRSWREDATIHVGEEPEGTHRLAGRVTDWEASVGPRNEPPQARISKTSSTAERVAFTNVARRLAQPRLEVRAAFTLGPLDHEEEVRLLVLGNDLWDRSFGLGLQDGRLDWRVRTGVTDRDGNGPGLLSPRPLAARAGVFHVQATFDPAHATVAVREPGEEDFEVVAHRTLAPLGTPAPLGKGGPALLALVCAVITVSLLVLGMSRGHAAMVTTLPVVALASWPGVGAFAAFPGHDLLLLPSILAALLALRVRCSLAL